MFQNVHLVKDWAQVKALNTCSPCQYIAIIFNWSEHHLFSNLSMELNVNCFANECWVKHQGQDGSITLEMRWHEHYATKCNRKQHQWGRQPTSSFAFFSLRSDVCFGFTEPSVSSEVIAIQSVYVCVCEKSMQGTCLCHSRSFTECGIKLSSLYTTQI